MDDISRSPGISTRLRSALRCEGIRTLDQLARYSWSEFHQIPNVGIKTVKDADALLKSNGMSFSCYPSVVPSGRVVCPTCGGSGSVDPADG